QRVSESPARRRAPANSPRRSGKRPTTSRRGRQDQQHLRHLLLAPRFGKSVLEADQEGRTGARSVFGGSKAFCSGRVEHPELRCFTTRKRHGACQVSSRASVRV